jgi:hypothetical protein
MSLYGIALHLNGYQLSDLFFNYEHPERDKLYAQTDPKSSIDPVEYQKAILTDATEFALVIGIPEDERVEFCKALAEDFDRRV